MNSEFLFINSYICFIFHHKLYIIILFFSGWSFNFSINRNLYMSVPESSLIYLLFFKWRNRIFITKSLSWIMFCINCCSVNHSQRNLDYWICFLYFISQNSICLWKYLFITNNELQNNCNSYCMKYWIYLWQSSSKIILHRLSWLFHWIYWSADLKWILVTILFNFSFNRNNVFDTFPMILSKKNARSEIPKFHNVYIWISTR